MEGSEESGASEADGVVGVTEESGVSLPFSAPPLPPLSTSSPFSPLPDSPASPVASASSVGVEVGSAEGSADGSADGEVPGSTPGRLPSTERPEITAQLGHAFGPWSSRTFSATEICCERLARSARGANAVPPYADQVSCENWSPP